MSTPAEREELARAVYDLLAAADAFEASAMLRVLGGRLTDTLRVMAWLEGR